MRDIRAANKFTKKIEKKKKNIIREPKLAL